MSDLAGWTEAVAVRLPNWRERGVRIAVAESLTGGLLTATLVEVPGISAVLHGGIVAYQTPLKHSLLGVSAELLAEHGAVHPQVAEQMAAGVRMAATVDGLPATIGVATTGVAGPDPQDGQAPGTVFLGLATEAGVWHRRLALAGDRASIRSQTVAEALGWLATHLDEADN